MKLWVVLPSLGRLLGSAAARHRFGKERRNRQSRFTKAVPGHRTPRRGALLRAALAKSIE